MRVDFSNALILVTGYTGFLGSNLVTALLKRGAAVIGLQLRTEDRQWVSAKLMNHPGFSIKTAAESKAAFLEACGSGKKKTACFHFAGNASAAECQKNPPLAYESNVQLTLKVLELCRSVGIKRFIYPSTGYVYGNHLKEPATEQNKLISTNIYTATKIASEALIESYAHFYDFECKIGRVSNVYGKESSYETVSGNIIRDAIDRKPIVLNTLKPIRDFIFIDDVIDAFLRLLQHVSESTCSYVNISTGIAISIQELAETACEIVALPKSNIISRGINTYSDTKLVLDCSKLKMETHWEPRHSIKTGLAKIVNGN